MVDNNLTFDESNYKIKSRSILGKAETPKMINFLMNKHIVKNERQGLLLMFGFTGLMLLATFFTIYLGFFSKPDISIPTSSQTLPVK